MNRVPLEKRILSENDRVAADLRERFKEHGTLCLNLISAPGSGKTSLLEKTLESVPQSERVAVLTGDIQTENDATRLRRFGFPVKQITTGGTCHLDARMIERHLAEENARRVHPEIQIVRTSCTSGDGLQEWFTWLQQRKLTQTAESEALV